MHATAEFLDQYHYNMYQTLKKGTSVEQLEDAFDGDDPVLASIAVRAMEKYGKELGERDGTGAAHACVRKVKPILHKVHAKQYFDFFRKMFPFS